MPSSEFYSNRTANLLKPALILTPKFAITEMMVGGKQRTNKEKKELYLLHFYRYVIFLFR